MNSMKKTHIVKTLGGLTIALSIAFTGNLVTAPQTAQAATVSGTAVADGVIATGKQFLGARYVFGAKTGRTDAFDCSSFTQYVFKQNGISIPRSSRQQAAVGTAVSKNQLQPGDLVFSDTNRDGVINHVGIYMGGGKVIHTYRAGIGVTISNYVGSTWDKTFVTARRVIDGSAQTAVTAATPTSATSKQPAVVAPVETPKQSASVNRSRNKLESTANSGNEQGEN